MHKGDTEGDDDDDDDDNNNNSNNKYIIVTIIIIPYFTAVQLVLQTVRSHRPTLF
jgi:hypothetical protein